MRWLWRKWTGTSTLGGWGRKFGGVPQWTPFLLDRYELHDGSIVESDVPLTIRGPFHRWHYAVGFPNVCPVFEAARRGPVEVQIGITVLEGKASVGLLRGNETDFIVQQNVESGRSATVLRLTGPCLRNISSLIVRNSNTDTPLRFVVHSLTTKQRPLVAETPYRGFGKKSILDDLNRLSEGRVRSIFDVGANVGDLAQEFADTFPTARIDAFEPHPEVSAGLHRRFEANRDITVVQSAVGETISTHELHCFSNSAVNSLYPITAAAHRLMDSEVTTLPSISVPVTTIDAHMKKFDIDHLDILKIDAQGHELAVLKGAEEALRDKRISFIVAELNFVPVYKGQSYFSQVAHYLHERGYELFDLYNFVYSDDGQVKWGDGLFRLTEP